METIKITKSDLCDILKLFCEDEFLASPLVTLNFINYIFNNYGEEHDREMDTSCSY